MFIKEWKEENRIVIPKVGRDDYHQCSSYRTISITSCLGKRFEYITTRLVSILLELNFDLDQHAYLKGRSTMQAVLSLVENIKKGILQDQCTGAVFFDLTDEFGSVDRRRLLHKIRKDFKISGRLLSHIESFLSNRFARLKLHESMGDWIESFIGTSEGTRLGRLLFIMHIHDAPSCIKPKYADDLVALSVDRIQENLQDATDQLIRWTERESMLINAIKTKVMVFGDQSHGVKIVIQNAAIEQVSSYKYLGVILDPKLDFEMKRAFSKISTLIRGRRGISVKLGIDLYKSLVRPHLEYAIPVWANICDKDMDKLEKTQVHCLKRVIGAKTHSSSSAVEVLCGVVPFRFRRRELCCREYIRMQAKDNGHELVQLMESSTRRGLRFYPLEYLKTVSRELHRA